MGAANHGWRGHVLKVLMGPSRLYFRLDWAAGVGSVVVFFRGKCRSFFALSLVVDDLNEVRRDFLLCWLFELVRV